MNIVYAIKHKYPTANSQRDFRVDDNGKGQFISLWELSETIPTTEELIEWWKEYIRSEKLKELKNKSSLAILGNFTSATTGHIYEFEEHDQANFTQQMLLLVSNPAITTVDWKTVDAGVVTHTREQFFAVVGDADSHKRGNMTKFWTKEAQLNSATTLDEINAVKWEDENV